MDSNVAASYHPPYALSRSFRHCSVMRWLLSGLLLALLGTVQALSTTGNRLLVVIDDVADKDLYSKFWTDLECECRIASPTG